MTVALHRRLKVAGAALAEAGRVHLPPGAAATWTDADVARVGTLLDTCGRALLARLDDEDLAALATRWDGEQGEE